MVIGVLKERAPETRVSLVPEVVAALVKMNVTVWVESGAGNNAFHNDKAYTDAGAHIKDSASIQSGADLVLSMNAENLSDSLKAGANVLGVYQPLFNASLMQRWAEKGYTV